MSIQYLPRPRTSFIWTPPHDGHRTTTPGAFMYTSTSPTACCVPQCAQVPIAAVISMVKISRSMPPIALPSSFKSDCCTVMSTSCGSETLGLDGRRVVTHVDQQGRHAFDQGCGPADVDDGHLRLRPSHFREHGGIDATRVPGPALGLLPGQRVRHREPVTRRREPVQLGLVDDVFERTRRVEKSGRSF